MIPARYPLCEICGAEISRPYATGLTRRYCGPRCAAEARRLWHQLTNRVFRRTHLLAPSCRLPEPERSEALARVSAEIADLEARLSSNHRTKEPSHGLS